MAGWMAVLQCRPSGPEGGGPTAPTAAPATGSVQDKNQLGLIVRWFEGQGTP